MSGHGLWEGDFRYGCRFWESLRKGTPSAVPDFRIRLRYKGKGIDWRRFNFSLSREKGVWDGGRHSLKTCSELEYWIRPYWKYSRRGGENGDSCPLYRPVDESECDYERWWFYVEYWVNPGSNRGLD